MSTVTKWKFYPAYKDSDVEWLGRIPSHWSTIKIRYQFRIIKGPGKVELADVRSDSALPYLSLEYLRGASEPAMYGEPTIASNVASQDDIVIIWDGSNSGEFLEAKRGIPSSTTGLLRPIHPGRFHFYVLKNSEAVLRGLTVGMGIPHVDPHQLKGTVTPEPPAEETRAIAAFLDGHTAKIDALVTKKERLIALLQEKRTALISRTITRGLPSTAARLPENRTFKPSGVPWLGEIPRDWTVARLRRACSNIFLGLTSTVDYVDDGGFPLVRALNIAGGKLDFAEARFISEKQHRQLTKYRRAKENDVLLSKSGSIGTAAFVETNREFSIYESIFVLRAVPSLLLPKYLLHVLRSDICQSQYLASLVGMGVGHLNMSDITEILVALPPLPEQVAIAAYLDDETAKLDALAAKVKEAIERLQEYRTALISAAVTGKIDVRDSV
jgi:type I restriction enzyme, S subunit